MTLPNVMITESVLKLSLTNPKLLTEPIKINTILLEQELMPDVFQMFTTAKLSEMPKRM